MITRGKVLLAVLISMLALAAPASAAAEEYVSLGDSYTAGPLIPVQVPLFGCLKSNNNFPNLTTRELGLSLKDASCSGAETEDMDEPAGRVARRPEPAAVRPPQRDDEHRHAPDRRQRHRLLGHRARLRERDLQRGHALPGPLRA